MSGGPDDGVRMGLFGRLFGRGKREGAEGDARSEPESEDFATGQEPPAPEEPPEEEPGEPVQIELAGDGLLEARLFAREGVLREVPGILWLHGDDPAGGGSSRAVLAELFVEHRPCVVLVVDHPADRAECHRALVWLRDGARRYGIATDQLFIGGTGPAADLALETALFERDEGGVALAYLMALYPSLGRGWDAGFSSVTRAKGLRGLPTSTLITGMGDPSRENVTDLVERLRADGVEVDFHMYRSRLRGTGMVGTAADVAQARVFVLRQLDEAVENCRAPQQRVRNIDLPTVD